MQVNADNQKYFLPSEIARLVLGFLKEENYKKTFRCFLKECEHLKEVEALLRQKLDVPLTIMGLSLNVMLQDYGRMKLEGLQTRQGPLHMSALWNQLDAVVANLKSKTTDSSRCLTGIRGERQSSRTKRLTGRVTGRVSRATVMTRDDGRLLDTDAAVRGSTSSCMRGASAGLSTSAGAGNHEEESSSSSISDVDDAVHGPPSASSTPKVPAGVPVLLLQVPTPGVTATPSMATHGGGVTGLTVNAEESQVEQGGNSNIENGTHSQTHAQSAVITVSREPLPQRNTESGEPGPCTKTKSNSKTPNTISSSEVEVDESCAPQTTPASGITSPRVNQSALSDHSRASVALGTTDVPKGKELSKGTSGHPSEFNEFSTPLSVTPSRGRPAACVMHTDEESSSSSQTLHVDVHRSMFSPAKSPAVTSTVDGSRTVSSVTSVSATARTPSLVQSRCSAEKGPSMCEQHDQQVNSADADFGLRESGHVLDEGADGTAVEVRALCPPDEQPVEEGIAHVEDTRSENWPQDSEVTAADADVAGERCVQQPRPVTPAPRSPKRKKKTPRKRRSDAQPLHTDSPGSSSDLSTTGRLDKNPLEKIINDQQFAKNLADHINKSLLSDSHQHLAVQKSTTAETRTSSSSVNTSGAMGTLDITSTDSVLDEFLSTGHQNMSEDTVNNIIRMTRNDPVFDSLFEIFDADKEEYIEREFGRSHSEHTVQNDSDVTDTSPDTSRGELHTPPPSVDKTEEFAQHSAPSSVGSQSQLQAQLPSGSNSCGAAVSGLRQTDASASHMSDLSANSADIAVGRSVVSNHPAVTNRTGGSTQCFVEETPVGVHQVFSREACTPSPGAASVTSDSTVLYARSGEPGTSEQPVEENHGLPAGASHPWKSTVSSAVSVENSSVTPAPGGCTHSCRDRSNGRSKDSPFSPAFQSQDSNLISTATVQPEGFACVRDCSAEDCVHSVGSRAGNLLVNEDPSNHDNGNQSHGSAPQSTSMPENRVIIEEQTAQAEVSMVNDSVCSNPENVKKTTGSTSHIGEQVAAKSHDKRPLDLGCPQEGLVSSPFTSFPVRTETSSEASVLIHLKRALLVNWNELSGHSRSHHSAHSSLRQVKRLGRGSAHSTPQSTIQHSPECRHATPKQGVSSGNSSNCHTPQHAAANVLTSDEAIVGLNERLQLLQELSRHSNPCASVHSSPACGAGQAGVSDDLSRHSASQCSHHSLHATSVAVHAGHQENSRDSLLHYSHSNHSCSNGDVTDAVRVKMADRLQELSHHSSSCQSTHSTPRHSRSDGTHSSGSTPQHASSHVCCDDGHADDCGSLVSADGIEAVHERLTEAHGSVPAPNLDRHQESLCHARQPVSQHQDGGSAVSGCHGVSQTESGHPLSPHGQQSSLQVAHSSNAAGGSGRMNSLAVCQRTPTKPSGVILEGGGAGDIFISPDISDDVCRTNISYPILPAAVHKILTDEILSGQLQVPVDLNWSNFGTVTPQKVQNPSPQHSTTPQQQTRRTPQSKSSSPKQVLPARNIFSSLKAEIGHFGALSKQKVAPRRRSPRKSGCQSMSPSNSARKSAAQGTSGRPGTSSPKRTVPETLLKSSPMKKQAARLVAAARTVVTQRVSKARTAKTATKKTRPKRTARRSLTNVPSKKSAPKPLSNRRSPRVVLQRCSPRTVLKKSFGKGKSPMKTASRGSGPTHEESPTRSSATTPQRRGDTPQRRRDKSRQDADKCERKGAKHKRVEDESEDDISIRSCPSSTPASDSDSSDSPLINYVRKVQRRKQIPLVSSSDDSRSRPPNYMSLISQDDPGHVSSELTAAPQTSELHGTSVNQDLAAMNAGELSPGTSKFTSSQKSKELVEKSPTDDGRGSDGGKSRSHSDRNRGSDTSAAKLGSPGNHPKAHEAFLRPSNGTSRATRSSVGVADSTTSSKTAKPNKTSRNKNLPKKAKDSVTTAGEEPGCTTRTSSGRSPAKQAAQHCFSAGNTSEESCSQVHCQSGFFTPVQQPVTVGIQTHGPYRRIKPITLSLTRKPSGTSFTDSSTSRVESRYHFHSMLNIGPSHSPAPLVYPESPAPTLFSPTPVSLDAPTPSPAPCSTASTTAFSPPVTSPVRCHVPMSSAAFTVQSPSGLMKQTSSNTQLPSETVRVPQKSVISQDQAVSRMSEKSACSQATVVSHARKKSPAHSEDKVHKLSKKSKLLMRKKASKGPKQSPAKKFQLKKNSASLSKGSSSAKNSPRPKAIRHGAVSKSVTSNEESQPLKLRKVDVVERNVSESGQAADDAETEEAANVLENIISADNTPTGGSSIRNHQGEDMNSESELIDVVNVSSSSFDHELDLALNQRHKQLASFSRDASQNVETAHVEVHTQATARQASRESTPTKDRSQHSVRVLGKDTASSCSPYGHARLLSMPSLDDLYRSPAKTGNTNLEQASRGGTQTLTVLHIEDSMSVPTIRLTEGKDLPTTTVTRPVSAEDEVSSFEVFQEVMEAAGVHVADASPKTRSDGVATPGQRPLTNSAEMNKSRPSEASCLPQSGGRRWNTGTVESSSAVTGSQRMDVEAEGVEEFPNEGYFVSQREKDSSRRKVSINPGALLRVRTKTLRFGPEMSPEKERQQYPQAASATPYGQISSHQPSLAVAQTQVGSSTQADSVQKIVKRPAVRPKVSPGGESIQQQSTWGLTVPMTDVFEQLQQRGLYQRGMAQLSEHGGMYRQILPKSASLTAGTSAVVQLLPLAGNETNNSLNRKGNLSAAPDEGKASRKDGSRDARNLTRLQNCENKTTPGEENASETTFGAGNASDSSLSMSYFREVGTCITIHAHPSSEQQHIGSPGQPRHGAAISLLDFVSSQQHQNSSSPANRLNSASTRAVHGLISSSYASPSMPPPRTAVPVANSEVSLSDHEGLASSQPVGIMPPPSQPMQARNQASHGLTSTDSVSRTSSELFGATTNVSKSADVTSAAAKRIVNARTASDISALLCDADTTPVIPLGQMTLTGARRPAQEVSVSTSTSSAHLSYIASSPATVMAAETLVSIAASGSNGRGTGPAGGGEGSAPQTTEPKKKGSKRKRKAESAGKICGEGFRDKSSLNKHLAKVHEEKGKTTETSPHSEKPYQCTHCKFRCKNAPHLAWHMAKHSDEASPSKRSRHKSQTSNTNLSEHQQQVPQSSAVANSSLAEGGGGLQAE
ncbi:hypothetical protein BaRGS_00014212, partial [Batillaria attramentaria]